MDVITYRNGDSIPHLDSYIDWRNAETVAWCWFNNDSATYAATYGKLYNWYALNDPRGLAPEGWRIPNAADVDYLVTCLGGASVAGGSMKETGTTHWLSPNTGATNISGFTALPGGFREGTTNASSGYVRSRGYYWTATPFDETTAYYMFLSNTSAELLRTDHLLMKNGMSVRCVRD